MSPRTARQPTTDATCTTARCASPSSASATAPRRSSRASSTTATPSPDDFVPGLMHVDLGGYHIRDIEFSAAFDIDSTKVGKDLSEAIFAGQNNTIKFADVPQARRHGAARHDARRPRQVPVARSSRRRPARPPTSSSILQGRPKADVLVIYLPVGSEKATKWYVEQALQAGVRLRQLHPGLHRPRGRTGSGASRRPACRSSATTSSRRSARRSSTACWPASSGDRGVRLERTYQLNFGGNTDFLNMLERERLESKKISKTNAVTSQLDYDLGADNVHIGPSRLRAVADRPQVGLHPPRGPHLRRRAAERRAQARGAGTRPTRPASSSTPCAAPSWRSTTASRGALEWPARLLHEVAAGPAPRRRGARRMVEEFIRANPKSGTRATKATAAETRITAADSAEQDPEGRRRDRRRPSAR